MGWLIGLGIVALLAIIPLGVQVRYDEDGILVRLIAGPVKLLLYPRPKKETEKKTKQPEKAKETDAEAAPQSHNCDGQQAEAKGKQPEAEPQKKAGGPITDFLPLVRIALDLLDTFRRRLRVDVLECRLVMAAEDPCDLAVNYGRAWAAIGNLMPRLERLFVIKKRNIEVECNFETTQTRLSARLDLTITLGRLLATAAVYGVKALEEFIKIKNKRKGGAS